MNRAGRWLTIALLVYAGTIANAASSTPVETAVVDDAHAYQADLPAITSLRLHLRDGDFRVVASDSDEIVIRADGKNRAQTRKMHVQMRRTADSLDITFSHVPKSECQITIAVPKETNLYTRMRAGDLSVNGITGDKDLELFAGDLSIQVPDAADYGPVDLSVRFGDVSAGEFGNPKGVMGNSLRRDGSGRYRLHAHVFAGDLTLN